MPVASSHITVTAYNVSAGTRLLSHDIPASWIAEGSRYYLLSILDSFSKSKMCKESVIPINFLIIALLLYDLLKTAMWLRLYLQVGLFVSVCTTKGYLIVVLMCVYKYTRYIIESYL